MQGGWSLCLEPDTVSWREKIPSWWGVFSASGQSLAIAAGLAKTWEQPGLCGKVGTGGGQVGWEGTHCGW